MNLRPVSLCLLMLLALGLFPALPWLFAATSQDGFYGVPAQTDVPALMRNGRDLLGDHERSASIVFFGYRGCSDACPLQLVNIMELQQRLSTEDFQFVFVTLAPVSSPWRLNG